MVGVVVVVVVVGGGVLGTVNRHVLLLVLVDTVSLDLPVAVAHFEKKGRAVCVSTCRKPFFFHLYVFETLIQDFLYVNIFSCVCSLVFRIPSRPYFPQYDRRA